MTESNGQDGPELVELRAEIGDLRTEIVDLRTEIGDLRTEIARLDADLDESRRLNLRAAELLDIVYETLGRPQGLS